MVNLIKSQSIFTRILLTSIAISILIIAIFSLITCSIVEDTYEKGVQDTLENTVKVMVSSINDGGSIKHIQDDKLAIHNKSSIRTTIIDNSGVVVFDSFSDKSKMTNHSDRPEIRKALSGELNFEKRFSNTIGKKMMYIAMPAGSTDGFTYQYCVRQSTPLDGLSKEKQELAKQIITLAFASVILSTILSLILARRLSSPLNQLALVAQELSNGNFSCTTPRTNIKELQTLGNLISNMSYELKEKITQLDKRSHELNEIFSHMNECVFICTQDGQLRRYNKSAEKLFNIRQTSEKITVRESFRNKYIIETIEEVFNTKKQVVKDIEFGNEKVYAITGIILPYYTKRQRALFVIRDISFERKNEALRREFVAGVSHELKTPLTAIDMASEALLDYIQDPQCKRFLYIIMKESTRINSLVNDMLLLSKIEFTKKFDAKTFDEVKLYPIVLEAVSIHELQAVENNDTFKINCPKDAVIAGDARLIQIALNNLINNAVKYAGKDITISINVEKTSNNKIKISVADNGSGIAQEHQSRIFERFYRVDKGRSRVQGGTGLGLAIVKHIAILHNGNVSIKSQIDKGTKFVITLG